MITRNARLASWNSSLSSKLSEGKCSWRVLSPPYQIQLQPLRHFCFHRREHVSCKIFKHHHTYLNWSLPVPRLILTNIRIYIFLEFPSPKPLSSGLKKACALALLPSLPMMLLKLNSQSRKNLQRENPVGRRYFPSKTAPVMRFSDRSTSQRTLIQRINIRLLSTFTVALECRTSGISSLLRGLTGIECIPRLDLIKLFLHILKYLAVWIRRSYFRQPRIWQSWSQVRRSHQRSHGILRGARPGWRNRIRIAKYGVHWCQPSCYRRLVLWWLYVAYGNCTVSWCFQNCYFWCTRKGFIPIFIKIRTLTAKTDRFS